MASVSLIIPCHNHSATLARAVGSALAQSFLHEICIVDDCSSDDSLNVAKQLAASDSRIKVLQTERNLGPGGARNAGVQVSVGDCVSFLDADDELVGDFIGEALSLLQAEPTMRVVKSEMEFFDPVKGYILPALDPRHSSAILSSSCGMLMRRQSFLRMGGFPEDQAFRGPMGGEDVAFMQAVIKHFQPIGRLERPGYRVWSFAGSHLDKFLSTTRLKGDSFEFVNLHPDQALDGPIARAMDGYLSAVALRVVGAEDNRLETFPF